MILIPILITIIFFATTAFLCVKIAKKLNQSRIIWGILGFITPFLALPVALILLVWKMKPWKKLMLQNNNLDSANSVDASAKNRKFAGGLVTLVLGIVGTVYSLITISSDMEGNGLMHYSYSSPFTGHEITMITVLIISIIAAIVGVIILVKK